MTMYVRVTEPITLTISSQTEDDDVLLDGNHPFAVLPLWAAQRDEFQTLWDEGKVEVALDPDFNDTITEIPASETGQIDPNTVATLDGGGRVPAYRIPSTLNIENITNSDNVSYLTFGDLNGPNHVVISNAQVGHSPQISVASGQDSNVNLELAAFGTGRVVINGARVLTGIQDINAQGGTLSVHATDAGTLVTINSATPATITVLSNDEDYAPIGTTIEVAQLGGGQLTFVGSENGGGVTLLGTPGLKTFDQYGVVKLRKIDTNTWLLNGDLTA